MGEENSAAVAERKYRVRRFFTAQDRERLLELFDRSGQCVREFCAEHEFGVSSLTAWRRQRRQSGKSAPRKSLVRVAVTRGTPREESDLPLSAVKIWLREGVQIQANVGADIEWLAQLTKRLGACSV